MLSQFRRDKTKFHHCWPLEKSLRYPCGWPITYFPTCHSKFTGARRGQWGKQLWATRVLQVDIAWTNQDRNQRKQTAQMFTLKFSKNTNDFPFRKFSSDCGLAISQWRSQPKNLGGPKVYDFMRITLFSLEKRLSKHKMTIFSKNLVGAWPLWPPSGYAYAYHISGVSVP